MFLVILSRIIREQTRRLSKDENFKGSKGWLDNFLHQYKHLTTICVKPEALRSVAFDFIEQ